MSKPMFLAPLIGKGPGRYALVSAARGSVFATHLEAAFDSKTRRRGLLGRDSVPEDYALIIAPCSSVHTFFMRFPIDLVFVSRDGTIVKTCRSVKPWRIAGAFRAVADPWGIAGAQRAYAVIEAAPGFIDRTEIVPGEIVGLREIPERRRAADVLPPLAATSSRDAGVSRARTPGLSKPVTLTDIIAHQTPLGWFESVAIVQEMCAAVLARGPADDPRVPELPNIALTPVGGVELLAEGPGGHSLVRRACLVLLALTPEAQLPTELRLFVLGGLLPTPRFESLKELHAELEFFERPDRLDIVRVVYERYQRLLAPSAIKEVKPPAELESPVTSLGLDQQAQRWWTRKWVRKWAWIGALVVVLALVAAAATWELQRPEGQWMRDRVGQLTQAASELTDRAVKAARGYRAVVWRQLGLPSTEPGEAAPAAAAGGAAARAAVKPRNAVPPARRQEPQALPPAPLGLPKPAEPPAAVGAVTPQPAGATPAPTSSPSQLPGALPAAVATIYSAADPLVVPPELVRPVLPKGPPPGVREEDLPLVEIVVSATGEVETVKLLSSGMGPRPAMMLSAVKTWIFQPAMREGQPVRYRYRVRLTR